MQNHPANQLDVEMAHAEDALTGFANGSEGFGQKLFEGLTVAIALAELRRFGPQRVIVERGHLGFEGVDLGNALVHAFQ